jgi:Heavy metal binding domain
MDRRNGQQVYLCPMHSGVRQPGPGRCPKCGMDLLPEGTRFGLLRHIAKNPLMLAMMVAIMVGVMALIMHLT